jgi:Ca2+-binding EF-hand superfamily protein
LLLKHGDSDGDGQVSQQEFLTVMEANVTSPEHFERAVLAIIDSLMKALDTNGNGVLSRDEYVRMYSALEFRRSTRGRRSRSWTVTRME